jgi:hypothetical protein
MEPRNPRGLRAAAHNASIAVTRGALCLEWYRLQHAPVNKQPLPPANFKANSSNPRDNLPTTAPAKIGGAV